MKKFASIVLALSLVAILPMNQVMAQEVSLDSAISNLQYSLTVEWNQKDAAVKNKILATFASEMAQLKKQGVSDAEIFTALSEKAFDAQTSKDLASLAQYAKANKLSQEETRKLITEYANKSQKLGTSWSGEAVIGVVLGLVLAGLIVAALTGNLNLFVSSSPSCHDECYVDYYGYTYCDTVCY